MTHAFDRLPFKPADILLPQNCDLALWSVVACDQYTSQPEYWQRVEDRVGKNPSALRLILPESCLDGPSVETDIMEINNTMTRYLRGGIFAEHPQSLFYVERALSSGAVRRGLIGMVDLDAYDYEPGASSPIRATEDTVLSRIPPRVRVRKNAPLELPHVLLLANDPQKTVIEPLSGQTGEMLPLYDFELMEGGGRIRGWKLNDAQLDQVAAALTALAQQSEMFLAVGDGNHSLACAKACYERRKGLTRPEQWPNLPSRYALAELGNLHDEGLKFEPIHRLLTNLEPRQLLDSLLAAYPGAFEGEGEGHVLRYLHGYTEGAVTIPQPRCQLPVGTLQGFLDRWLEEHRDASIDYIHGENVARQLAARPRALAFFLDPMEKEHLFPTVIQDGKLPRKTFSMGEAQDKRFYLEARKIRV
jgi:uncharacterized protein (DUF1015 family)